MFYLELIDEKGAVILPPHLTARVPNPGERYKTAKGTFIVTDAATINERKEIPVLKSIATVTSVIVRPEEKPAAKKESKRTKVEG
jgi:hypothetical protein